MSAVAAALLPKAARTLLLKVPVPRSIWAMSALMSSGRAE